MLLFSVADAVLRQDGTSKINNRALEVAANLGGLKKHVSFVTYNILKVISCEELCS